MLACRFASLWAHESMWVDPPPLRRNTSVIQGWRVTLDALSRILVTLQGGGPHRGGRPTPLWWVPKLISSCFVISCIKCLKYKWNLLLIKICSCYAILPFILRMLTLFWVCKIVTFSPSTRSPSLTFTRPGQTIKLSLVGLGVATMLHIPRVPSVQQTYFSLNEKISNIENSPILP